MRVLLAHVSNPNFLLQNGIYKARTFLQGVIALGNKELLELLMADKHGYKTKWVKSLIIDYESAEWLKTGGLPSTPPVTNISVVTPHQRFHFVGWGGKLHHETSYGLIIMSGGAPNEFICVGSLDSETGKVVSLTPEKIQDAIPVSNKT